MLLVRPVCPNVTLTWSKEVEIPPKSRVGKKRITSTSAMKKEKYLQVLALFKEITI